MASRSLRSRASSRRTTATPASRNGPSSPMPTSISARGGITPFIGAVIGASYNQIASFTDIGATQAFGNTILATTYGGDAWKLNFAQAAYAGLSYQVNQPFSVEMAYRYLNLGQATTGLDQLLLRRRDDRHRHAVPVQGSDLAGHQARHPHEPWRAAMPASLMRKVLISGFFIRFTRRGNPAPSVSFWRAEADSRIANSAPPFPHSLFAPTRHFGPCKLTLDDGLALPFWKPADGTPLPTERQLSGRIESNDDAREAGAAPGQLQFLLRSLCQAPRLVRWRAR